MLYAYFNSEGELLSMASRQSDFPEAHEFEVPNETDANSIYLDLEAMEVRQKQPFEVTASYNLLSGLPEGTHVLCSEGEFVVNDGTMEFEADMFETLNLYINHPHYLGQYVEVPTGPEVS